jgi:hypothetical protein
MIQIGFYLTENTTAFQVIAIDEDDTVDGIDMIQMIDEIAFAQVDGHFTVGRCFFKDFH